MQYQFIRVCKLEVGKPNEEGLSFDQRFRIEFDINKSITQTNKYNTIKIHNLAQENREKLKDIIEKNSSLIKGGQSPLLINLYAGYAEDTGLEILYMSHIVNISSQRDPPNVITEFKCAEAILNFKDNFVSLGMNAGVSTKEIYKNIASGANLTIDDTSNIPNINFAHGYSVMGSAKEALNKVSKQVKTNWTVEQNKIRIAPKGGHTNDSVVLISSKTGMIGSPERIDTSGDDTETAKIKHGWKVTCLLQPKILPNRRVRIESEAISGNFIVDSVNHKGCSLDGDWQSIIEIKEAF